MDVFSTGIAELDTLLGGGFKKGSTIVLRGQAGTGKTTLALQIGRHAVSKLDQQFVYVSTEEAARESLERITRAYWDRPLEKYLGSPFAGSCSLIDLGDEWDELLRKAVTQIRTDGVIPEPDSEGKFMGRKAREEVIKQETEHAPADVLRQKWAKLLKGQVVSTVLAQVWHKLSIDRNGRDTVLVVDSLNALIYRAQSLFRRYSERQMLLGVLESFKRWRRGRKGLTVIFTAEDSDGEHTPAAESYIADTVIELRKEPRTYEIPLTADQPIKWSEELLFCRVTKGRGMKTQRRPCCYEFVQGQGVKFFSTYAAQGLVSLFHENLPQLQVIQTLREVDVPSSYPGVLVQEFTQTSLQRMFSVRRHQQKIPPRHPLALSHVDEYWIEVLREHGLLHPIPRDKLAFFSLPLEQHRTGRPVIEELAKGKDGKDGRGKEHLYLDDKGDYLAVPQMGNVGMLVYRTDLLKAIGRDKQPPATWEELEEVCKVLAKQRLPCKLLLELQSYDTLVATALELGWSHGFFWKTRRRGKGPAADESLQVEVRPGSVFDDFVDALAMLHRWIHVDRIVPLRSTVDAEQHPNNDWAFARHWYSTWVDVRTRRKKGRLLVRDIEGMDFDVARIPISASYRGRQGPRPGRGYPYQHHSAAGEWYLAIQKGSENAELGIDLINNLMTARKVTERALAGAELPILEQFYKNFGPGICPHTHKSFNEIREMFAADARSRTEFQNFRKVARILYGAIWTIVTNYSLDRPGIKELLIAAFREIDPAIEGKVFDATLT